MNYKICLILVFLFSVIGVSAFPLESSDVNFKNLEVEVNSISSFYENGVKLQYKSEKSEEAIFKSLKEIVKSNYDDKNIELLDGEIVVIEDNIKLNINIWKDHDETNVEVVVINRDESVDTDQLKKILNKFEENECKEVQYFKYLKGNINNIKEGLNLLQNTSEAKNVNTLQVHNGYISTASLKSGERVNIALSSYNSGTYLIIGTPIIFATY